MGGQTVKKLRKLKCKFDLNQSERKCMQVNANARKSTCVAQVYLRLLVLPFGQDFKVFRNPKLWYLLVTRIRSRLSIIKQPGPVPFLRK